MQINRISLGQFENISGRFAISDPCYDTDTWCRGELEGVRKGIWLAYVEVTNDEKYGERVAELKVVHASYAHFSNTDFNDYMDYHLATFGVGVDSGQAGIFDVKHYRDDSVFCPDKIPNFGILGNEAGEKWYGFCCDATLHTEHSGGTISFGAVSRSGFGDGSYPCDYYRVDDGENEGVSEIVKVSIIFIWEDDEDEDGGEDEECND